MKIKLLTLLTGIIGTTAAIADVQSFEGYSLNSAKEANTCKYVGIGFGNPNIDMNLGARKQWGYSGVDFGINGETTSPIRKEFGDASQVSGYANYLFFPNGTKDARLYLGAGASAGLRMEHKENVNELIGAGNLLVGRSFANKQFVQAKVGFPVKFDRDSTWMIKQPEGSTPALTVSYGIGF